MHILTLEEPLLVTMSSSKVELDEEIAEAINQELIKKVFTEKELKEKGTMGDCMDKMASFLYYDSLPKRTQLSLQIKYHGRKKIPRDVLQDLAKKNNWRGDQGQGDD